LHFRILGPLEVEDGRQSLPLGGHQQRALLALLLLRANEVVPVDEIIEGLWGAESPASATKSVHALVSKLRRRLEGEAADDVNGETGENGVLLTRPHGYVLTVADGELDLYRFQSLMEQGRGALAAGQAAEAADGLREALALWRGPPLIEFAYDSFAQIEIARLEELRLSGVEERVEAELALGLHHDLISELEALVTKNPLRERLRGQLMLALYRSGRQAQALAAYQRARRTLVDEFGIEPSPALQRLEQAILQQDESLELRPESRPPVPAPVGKLAEVVEAHPTRRRLHLPWIVVSAAVAAVAFIALLAFRGGGNAITVRPNSVAVIDPKTNKIVADVAVGKRPGPADFGRGAVWVANLDDSTLSRINPRTREVERTIPMPDVFPSDIASGEGAVWVANGPDNTVLRVSPDANDVVDTIRTNRCNGYDAGIAVGGGAVWFVCSIGIVQIDPARNKPHRFRYLGLVARGITFGLGAVWVSNADNTVSRISPRTHRVSTLTVAHDPRGLDTGYGAAWVSAFGADAISRLAATPEDGSRIGSESIPVGDGPVDVAVGAGGVWVANSRDGTVSRIDPQSNKVIATIHVGSSPQRIAVGAGAVWVSVQAREPGGLPR
jgi:YVTN family beta-propeller protein